MKSWISEQSQAQSASTERYNKMLAQYANIKRKHKALPQNASTNGGDASRVGKKESNKQL